MCYSEREQRLNFGDSNTVDPYYLDRKSYFIYIFYIFVCFLYKVAHNLETSDQILVQF